MYMIIGEFSKWLSSKKTYSKSTMDNYCRTLIALDDFIRINSQGDKRIQNPEKINLEDIKNFIAENKTKGKKITTTNNYLAWIKMFFLFCKNKWLTVLDENKLTFTKEPKYNVETLKSDDTVLLLNQLKNNTNKSNVLRIRDYAIGLTLVYWWLKVQELCDLKINNLWENIQIIEKWNSRRVVPFNKEHLKVIERYLSLRNELWITSEYVFISHSKNSLWNKLSRVSVEEIIRKAGEKAWIGKVRPHKLRHTYAAQKLKDWEDKRTISQALWYKNKRAAQRYLNQRISKQ